MSQISTGTVFVTNGSAIVTGNNTQFVTDGVSVGDLFIPEESLVGYEVASITNETELQLTAPYQGTTIEGADYVIHTSFTPNKSYPFPETGDFETATIVKRAIKKIDEDDYLDNNDFATTAQHEAATATDLVANPAGVKAHLDSRLANGSGSGVLQAEVAESIPSAWSWAVDDETQIVISHPGFDGNIRFGHQIDKAYIRNDASQASSNSRLDFFHNGGVAAGNVGDMGPRTLNARELYENGNRVLAEDSLANGSGSGVLQGDVAETITGNWQFNSDVIFDVSDGELKILRSGATPEERWRIASSVTSNLILFNSDSATPSDSRIILGNSGNPGVQIGEPSGGRMGAGTLNAQAVYDDGSLLTDYVLDAYLDGQIDYDYYDSKVLPRTVGSETETEEVEEEEEVTEECDEYKDEWDEKQQAYIRRKCTTKNPIYDEHPVLDEDGTQIGVRRVKRTQKVKKQVPKQVEVRDEHAPAKRYEFDDLDCDAFWAKCEKFRKLPAFQRCEDNLREGQERPSMGQVAQALTETVEDMAVHIHKINERLKRLENER